MIRILTLIAGLAGAAGLSQFPEFSQQYLQRLAGAVDELTRVVADFDASANGVGMSREQALQALSEGAFQQARQADMRRTIARAERLSADLEALRSASMVARALQPQRFTDPEIAAAAWADFRPAMPVTATGAGFAGAGFVGGAALFGGVLWLAAWPFRRRKAAPRRPPAPPHKAGPAARPTTTTVRRDPPPLSAQAANGPRPALPLGWLARTNDLPHKVVQAGRDVQVSVLSLAPEDSLTGQGGKGFDLVIVCLDGAGEIAFDGTARKIAPGELVTLPPGSAYDIRNTGEAVLKLFALEPRSALAPTPVRPRLTA